MKLAAETADGSFLSLFSLSLSGRKSGETEGKRAREEKEKENVERVVWAVMSPSLPSAARLLKTHFLSLYSSPEVLKPQVPLGIVVS